MSDEFAMRKGISDEVARTGFVGQQSRADAWTTSCWQLPDARWRNQAVPLMGQAWSPGASMSE